MTRTLAAALLLASVPALTGCGAPRIDPEPPADTAGPAFPATRLCLQVSSVESVEPVLKFYEGHFADVEKVVGLTGAVKEGCALTASVSGDFISSLKWTEYDTFRLTVKFYTPDGAMVEKLKAEGQSMGMQDFGGWVTASARLTKAKAVERALKRTVPAMRASAALRAVAQGSPAPAFASPATRPAAAASKPTSALIPGYRLPENENKFALIVGIERYQSLPSADRAAADARSVKEHLLAAGYPERNIVLVADEMAGKAALEKYLEAWLPRNTDEKSTVFFYYSGHGAPDIAKGEAYLMPTDADAKFVEATGYSVKRLYRSLGALKAKRVLVAMDACFSGIGGRSVLAKGARPLVTKIDDGRADAGRVTALAATASDEYTGTDEASGHGLFTYHLLRALEARGGQATFKQLFDDVSPKVRDAARRDNREQTPQLIGDGAASL